MWVSMFVSVCMSVLYIHSVCVKETVEAVGAVETVEAVGAVESVVKRATGSQ